MQYKIAKTLIVATALLLPGAGLGAITNGVVDGPGEYRFNAEASPNDKHNTHGHGISGSHGGNNGAAVDSKTSFGPGL